MRFKALFFDVGNTLLFPNEKQILQPLHERGIFPSSETLRSVEQRTKREFDALIQTQRAVDHGFWQIFYSHLLAGLELQDDDLRDELVFRTQTSANWDIIRPKTRDALLRLRRSHRLGVISNADGTILQVLERCGIADCFETVTDSGIVGAEKPDPAIFRAAVQSLNVTPEESLYVGDVYSVDYLGAIQAGMYPVLFDVAGVYRNDPVRRVESLDELERRMHCGLL